MSDRSNPTDSYREYFERRLDRLTNFVAWAVAFGVGIGCYLYLTHMFRADAGIALLVSFFGFGCLGYFIRERLSGP